METVMLIAGWALWGLALLFGMGSLASRHPDGGVRHMMHTQGLVMLAACAATVLLPISKFWLLVAFPVAFFLPHFMMRRRLDHLEALVAKLQGESEATGVPVMKLLERETERLQGEKPEGSDADIEQMQRELYRVRHKLGLLEDPETICSFGQMALYGDGVERDCAEAANWFRIASEMGHARAQHNLAIMYENGQGVPRDSREAARLYGLAAAQGHAGSKNNLGALCESGDGVPQDRALALDLYRQAADGGDENAALNVLRLESLIRQPDEK